jgi:hypothetical protein
MCFAYRGEAGDGEEEERQHHDADLASHRRHQDRPGACWARTASSRREWRHLYLWEQAGASRGRVLNSGGRAARNGARRWLVLCPVQWAV